MIKLFEQFKQLLEVNTNNIEIIKSPNEQDFNSAIELTAKVLAQEGQSAGLENYIRYNSERSISIIAKNGDIVIGALLCKEETISNMMNTFNISTKDIKIDINEFNEIKDQLCIQGFSLAVSDEYRFSRVIYKLVEQLDKSYYGIIINQDESLQKNINYLRKGAKLIISSIIYGHKLNVYFGKF